MGIILNNTSHGIVVSEPHNIIGGKDSLKISITFKPDNTIYDYTNNQFFKSKKYYMLFHYAYGDYEFFMQLYTNNKIDYRIKLQITNTGGRLNKEISTNIGNAFSDGLPHSIGFQYFNTGHITYFIDDINVSTDRWNTSGEGKTGVRGNIIVKYTQMVLGNNCDLNYAYPMLGEYFDLQIAEEVEDEEGDMIFGDYTRSYINGDIGLVLSENVRDVIQNTDNLSDDDMIMIDKEYKKGRFNKKLTYRNNNISTQDLLSEANLFSNVTDDIFLQNNTATVIVRAGDQ